MAAILSVSLCNGDIAGRQPLHSALGGGIIDPSDMRRVLLCVSTGNNDIGTCGFGSTCLAFGELILQFANYGAWGEGASNIS